MRRPDPRRPPLPRCATDPVDYYLGVLADKTGVLIATAARYGAMFAGCDAATVETMREFGERLGIAFQLADDLIDIESEADETGKTPGTDLREGKRTLPVIHVLASDDPADARLQALLTGDLEDDARVDEALRLLRVHPAMDRARGHTYAVARQAQDVLVGLPESDAKDALHALATGVVAQGRLTHHRTDIDQLVSAGTPVAVPRVTYWSMGARRSDFLRCAGPLASSGSTA